MKKSISVLFSVVAICWVVWLINTTFDGALLKFGIQPRTLHGLCGILFAPFLHGDLRHLLSNTVPLLILGGTIAIHDRRTFNSITAWNILFGGGLVWLLARSAVHVGASGLIFGYFGFIVARGWFDRSFISLTIGLVVGVTYASILWGVLPSSPGVSWEGHLFGLIAGVVGAKLNAKPRDSDVPSS